MMIRETHTEIGLLKLGTTFNGQRITRLIEKSLRKLGASPFECAAMLNGDASTDT